MSGENVAESVPVDPRWFALGEDWDVMDDVPTKEMVDEKARVENAEKYLKSHKPEFDVFARDKTLRYQTSGSAETFAFYPKTNTVEMPLSWFDAGKYTENELNFSNYHELSHFADMRKNPEAFLGNFARMREKAKELAAGYVSEHPGRAQGPVEKFYYDELHTLYNCIDDVYVNNLVRARAAVYTDTEVGRGTVASLYDKLGFGEADLTKAPLHRQMAYQILRDEMVGEERGKSIVAQEVEEAISRKHLGKSLKDALYEKLRPLDGVLIDPGERYSFVQKRIEPIYLELLEKSLEQKEEQEPPKKDVAGEPEEGDFRPFGDMGELPEMPNSVDENTVRDILKSCEEKDEIDKTGKNDVENERAKEKFDKEFGVSKGSRELYESIMREVEKPRQEMRKFWNSLIGKSIEFERRVKNEQTRGRLNVSSLIRSYPTFFDATRSGNLDKLKIYDREQLEQVVVAKPELIDISLVVDGSTSMDGERNEMARKTAELLMLSIKDFNQSLDGTRAETKSKLRADAEVIMFGTGFERVKEFERGKGRDRNAAEIIKSVARITSDWGSTNDAGVLKFVEREIGDEARRKLKEQKYLKIVFEITDGEPDDPEETRAAVEALKKDGVLAFAFQIGDVGEDGREKFEAIWNAEGQKPTGVYVGNDLEKLPQELMKALKRAMGGIRL